MTQMRMFKQFVCVAVLAGAAIACGDVARQGQSPVFLVIESMEGKRGGTVTTGSGAILTSDVITNVTTPEPCSPTAPCPTIFADSGAARIRLAMKDIGNNLVPTAPTSNNAVTLSRYRVAYRRADGRNTPGVDVPYAFDGAATVTISSTTATTVVFELVRVNAKAESPLVQMKTNGVFVTTLADVTFYGQDQVGNDVSVTGTIQIDFGNFGDF